MRIFNLFVVIMLGCITAAATGDSTHYVLPTDSIALRIDLEGNLLFRHTLAPGQTLYSLAKHYGLSVNELSSYNPSVQFNSYRPGTQLEVPIPLPFILQKQPADYRSGRYAPVFYRVRRGDTVFGISRRYFDCAIDTLRKRNHLTRDVLSQGQLLFVGWLPIRAIDSKLQTKVIGYYERLNLDYKSRFQNASRGKRVSESRGKAAWIKSASKDADFVALHRTAPYGSIIEVYNPMTRKTFYLRVIGSVPDQLYDRNTVVVVSPVVVKALRARDDSFYVYVRHY